MECARGFVFTNFNVQITDVPKDGIEKIMCMFLSSLKV